MIAIVESQADNASVHICEHLRRLVDWDERKDQSRPASEGGGTYYLTEGAELRSFEAFHLDLERPVDAFGCDPDLLVFASRHSGETGPLLTAHFTGNVGPAEYGGDDYALAETCPNALVAVLESFERYAPDAVEDVAPDGYDVGMECTHHGPTNVGCPSLFAELGSGKPQWNNPAGAKAVARAILDLRGVDPHRNRQLVGFGGNHYTPRFARIVRETPWAVGHVFAGWGLEAMGAPEDNRTLLERAFETSRTDLAVFDGEYPELHSTLADMGYRVVSETWVREVGDRTRPLVERVESRLGEVDEGVRFGTDRAERFEVVDLPEDLLGTAEGIDPAAVWDAVEGHSVAFETANGASRVGTRAAFASDERYRVLLAELATVLEAKFDAVRLENDALIAEETAFDPAQAHELGVPEGPKFGALADGESVTVDGERIDPTAVHVERTHRFPV